MKPTTIADQASEVMRLIDEMGAGPVHLVGLSFGGAVATAIAHSHPKQIVSLALIASVITGQPEVLNARANAAENAGDSGSYLKETLSRWFSPQQHGGKPADYVAECLSSTPVDNWVAGWRALAQHDGAAMLPEINVPTAVISGELDLACSPASLLAASQALPNGTYEEIPGAGHMIALEQPFVLARMLRDHIVAAEAQLKARRTTNA